MSPRLLPGGSAQRFADLLDAVGTSAAVEAPTGLAELLALRQALAAVPAPSFDPAASARIRQRLLAVATVQGGDVAEATTGSGRALSWQHRRLATVAVGGLSVLTAASGVALGAAHALPGQPLYGVKRATESIQLDLAHGDAARATREQEFAATRLSELRQVGPNSSHAAALLRSINSDTTAAQNDATSAARSSHNTMSLVTFESFARSQWLGLAALAPKAPSALLPQLHTTIAQVSGLEQKTVKLVGSMTHSPSSLPGLGSLGGVPSTSVSPPVIAVSPGAKPPTGHHSSAASPGAAKSVTPGGAVSPSGPVPKLSSPLAHVSKPGVVKSGIVKSPVAKVTKKLGVTSKVLGHLDKSGRSTPDPSASHKHVLPSVGASAIAKLLGGLGGSHHKH